MGYQKFTYHPGWVHSLMLWHYSSQYTRLGSYSSRVNVRGAGISITIHGNVPHGCVYMSDKSIKEVKAFLLFDQSSAGRNMMLGPFAGSFGIYRLFDSGA